MRSAVAAALDALSPRERRVLELRFGFELGRQQTLDEIGELLAAGLLMLVLAVAHAVWGERRVLPGGAWFPAAGALTG